MDATTPSAENSPSREELQRCIATLDELSRRGDLLAELSSEERTVLFKAAGTLSRPSRVEKKLRNKAEKQALRQKVIARERNARAATGIRSARETPVFKAPERIADQSRHADPGAPELASPRTCYICKAEFSHLHFFYDALCPACAEFNYQKRFQTAPLTDKVAIITGSRLKIGYQATLMMLRAGATVIATTRFPRDSAQRYSREGDFAQWRDRLQVFGLDLRHTPSVELFCRYVSHKYDRLDLLINNAAQTVRRPPGFYAHLLPLETAPLHELPEAALPLLADFHDCTRRLEAIATGDPADTRALPVQWNGSFPGLGLSASARLSQIPYGSDRALDPNEVFPRGRLDADLQQVDMRSTNSWRLRLGENEIQTNEMIELQLVNAIAPFILCNQLAPMMKRDNTGQKHIVNVSAMEGKFFRFEKGDRHPHTNMAKAALNMLTHTSASGLAKYGIFMNAVDTGWVTDEDPAALVRLKQKVHDFQPPLDIVDGAARVCDPFFNGILTGKHWCGKFLKDYGPIDW